MSTKDTPDNPPAFSIMHGMEFVSDRSDAPDYQVGTRIERGMTLRDYFAAAALPIVATTMEGVHKTATSRDISPSTVIAISAYEIANAMLRERAKGVA